MVWIILAVLVVGFFIVRAINKSTVNNAIIAQQQYLNSPEHKKQAQASLAYFNHITDILDCRVRIAKHKLQLINPPAHYIVSIDHKTGKPVPKTKALTDTQAIREALKYDIASDEALIEDLKKDYEKDKVQYAGYHPESLELIKEKYDLAIPFGPTPEMPDYINEDGASSWSMYEESKKELHSLERQLNQLESPKKATR